MLKKGNKSLDIQGFFEINSYIIFGVLTTVINIVCYEVLCRININYKVSNTIAFIIAVVFAYVTNKYFVFKTKNNKVSQVMWEFIKFIFYRTATYVIEFALLVLSVDKLAFHKSISKWLVSALVIILNYIFSKRRVFRNSGG